MTFRKWLFAITHWEQWHYEVKYLPLLPFWAWHCIRSGSFWFFSAANPGLDFGGWDGESKWQMYHRLPQETYPKSILVKKGTGFPEIQPQLQAFAFPMAVKPDRGLMGLLFRKLDTIQQLEQYHHQMPLDYIIQELEGGMEVSVFYYRMPGAASGSITGFVHKDGLEVKGDGVSTLDRLLQALVGRPGFKLEEWRNKHSRKLNRVLFPGEVFKLSWVANLSRGGRLISLENKKDEQLLKIFDNLSHQSGFYYGRYDIKCNSVEALKKGAFKILEFNGAGAEPHHVYGNGYSLLQAYRILLHHWKVMAQIARAHHKRGTAYWGFRKGLMRMKQSREHLEHLKILDQQIKINED